MRMAPQTRIHGVNSRLRRDWSWTCELLVMEMLIACRLEFFFAGGCVPPSAGPPAVGRGPSSLHLCILGGDPL
jgi:hypothetical protein